MPDNPDSNLPQKGNGRLVILAVFAAFLAPVLIAMLMQSSLWSYQPESSKAHGKLIKPVVELNELKSIINERSKWWLLTIDNSDCAGACEKTLIEMRQLRKAAGAHTQDLALLYISPSKAGADLQQRIQTIEPRIQQVASRSLYELVANTASSTPSGGQVDDQVSGQVWLLDRDLNLFMYYPAGHNATGIRKDLKRILTWALEKPQ